MRKHLILFALIVLCCCPIFGQQVVRGSIQDLKLRVTQFTEPKAYLATYDVKLDSIMTDVHFFMPEYWFSNTGLKDDIKEQTAMAWHFMQSTHGKNISVKEKATFIMVEMFCVTPKFSRSQDLIIYADDKKIFTGASRSYKNDALGADAAPFQRKEQIMWNMTEQELFEIVRAKKINIDLAGTRITFNEKNIALIQQYEYLLK